MIFLDRDLQSALLQSYSENNTERSQPAFLQSYGEQDYDLKEMTWPPPSCDMLLTDKDIREGDEFLAQMEEKRIVRFTTS